MQHTSFVNNKGQYGNFFVVFELVVLFVDVRVAFKNLSVVSDDNFPGLVIHEYHTLSRDSNIIHKCSGMYTCGLLCSH